MELEIFIVNKDTPDKVTAECVTLLLQQMDFIECPSTFDQVENALQLALDLQDTTKVFAARSSGGEIVGVLFANKGTSVAKSGYYLWINELHVKNTERNKGVATALLNHVFEWCQGEDVAGITLAATPDNGIAGKLYYKHGFSSEQMVMYDKIF